MEDNSYLSGKMIDKIEKLKNFIQKLNESSLIDAAAELAEITDRIANVQGEIMDICFKEEISKSDDLEDILCKRMTGCVDNLGDFIDKLSKSGLVDQSAELSDITKEFIDAQIDIADTFFQKDSKDILIDRLESRKTFLEPYLSNINEK